MRIVGEIPHPVYKISILQHMGRFILKFEADATEQSYKLRESNSIQSVKDVEALVTPAFLKKIDKVFLALGDNLMALIGNSIDDEEEDIELIEGII